MKIRKLLFVIGLAILLSPSISAQVFEDSKTQEAESKKSVFVDNSANLMWQDDIEARTVTQDWQGAVDYCSNLSLAGFDDWILPDLDTLKALYPKKSYLKNVVSDRYWSSSRYISDSSRSWSIFFYGGYDGSNDNSSSYYVRCVRNTNQIEASKFAPDDSKKVVIQANSEENKDSVFIDNSTNLIWQDDIEANTI